MSLAVQYLYGFRRDFGPDNGLNDLEACLKGKLAILKRREKRSPAKQNASLIHEISAVIREVHSMRFDAVARRCAMPRMSIFVKRRM